MIQNRLEILKSILAFSTQIIKEASFKKSFPIIYDEIINYSLENNIPFKNKIYHWVSGLNEVPLCDTCKTNKVNIHKNLLDGYRNFCSKKCSASSETTKLNRLNTCQRLYNVDNVAQYEPTKLKTANTNIDIYGFKSSFQNLNVRLKWRNNYLLNNDIDHPSKDKNRVLKSLSKASDTYKNKTGYLTPFNNPSVLESIKEGKNDLLFSTYNDRLDIKEYCLIEYISSLLHIQHLKCGNDFIINSANFRYRELNDLCFCTTCYPISENVSIKEKEISKYIKSLGYEVINNDRTILFGKELDIFIPSINVAIEYNGLYYHNISNTDKYYHYSKCLEAFKLGICLIVIWEGSVDLEYLVNILIAEPINIVDSIYDFNQPYRFNKYNGNIEIVEPTIIEKISNKAYMVYDCGGLYLC